MTSFAQVRALVDSHVNRDYVRFRAVTLQIAAHTKSERDRDQLRKLVEQQQAVSLVPMPGSNGLISAPSEMSTLDDMVLAPQVRAQLDRVVLEQSRKLDLLASGRDLRPASKLLFTGSAGVGKSMGARALAHAVGLPLFRVELHEVISSHMGETAGKLAKVFTHVRTMPAVYLFDEFDALGTARGSDGSAAGNEMRRVVNSLLQLIEDDRSDSLIVAATNHDQMLDSALFRRFDETIAFPLPSQVEVTTLVQRALGDDVAQLEIDFAAIYEVTRSFSLGHADVRVALSRVLKGNLLADTPIDTAHIVEAISRRQHGGAA